MKPTRTLQTLLAVLPVFTAGLYLLGLSYQQGYLTTFGINDTAFPLASDQALFTGFLSLVNLTFPAGLYAILALGALVILVLVAAVLSSTTRVRSVVASMLAWFPHRGPKATISPVTGDLVDKSATAYAYGAGFVVGVLLLYLITLSSFKSGGELATKEIANFQSGKTTRAELFSSQVPRGYVGMLLLCGEIYCAFWSSTGTILLRHETIDQIVLHPSSATSTNGAASQKSDEEPREPKTNGANKGA
jgi:hypothetical protein